MNRRTQPLLQWQRSLYEHNHQTRANLLVHAVTNPLFLLGNLLLLHACSAGLASAVTGVVLSVAAIAAQGRTHASERNAPVPFDGPLDAIARIFAEQWITFPRFVFDGGFSRAWSATAAV